MNRAALTAIATGLLLAACGPKESTTPPVAEPAATVEETPAPETVCNYIVLIDAGSTNSRAYTYQIDTPEEGGIPTLTQLSYAKVEPGLASFKDSPDGAAGSVTSLLTDTESVLAKLPDECEGKTPTALMATAGMRLLEAEAGGDAAAEALYESVRQAIKDTGLDLRFAGTISGQQEALYTWASANYALGNLSADQGSIGTLDLGSVASSIAFIPENGEGPTATLKFGDTSFSVYAQSYIGYGVDQARQYVADNACFPKGLAKGKGRFDQCLKKLTPVITPKSCNGGACGLAQPGVDAKPGVPQPALPSTMKFVATGHFAGTSALLKPEAATLASFSEAAGGAKGDSGFCGTKWAKLTESMSDVPAEKLENVCFTAGWITSLLEGYGFDRDSEQLTWTDRFGDVDSGWALGAALCSVTNCLAG